MRNQIDGAALRQGMTVELWSNRWAGPVPAVVAGVTGGAALVTVEAVLPGEEEKTTVQGLRAFAGGAGGLSPIERGELARGVQVGLHQGRPLRAWVEIQPPPAAGREERDYVGDGAGD